MGHRKALDSISGRFSSATIAIALLLSALYALWPQDVSFINDEPLLIEAALAANASGTLAVHGLLGTHGAVYGPLPTWIYQAYLLFSHDLVALVALRAFVLSALTTFALLWLGRTLALPSWFALLPLCSPFLWGYSRGLWDNTFAIPLCALAVAAHAAFLEYARTRHLVLTLGLCAGLLLVHLMALPLVIPIGLQLLIARGPELLRRWRAVSLTVACGMLAAFPYLRYIVEHDATGNGIDVGSWKAWAFPSVGAWLLSALRFTDSLGVQWFAADSSWAGSLVRLAQYLSLAAFPISWAGMVLAARELWQAKGAGTHTTRTQLFMLAFAVIAAQVLLIGLTGRYRHPHYFNATWIAYALFAWLALDRLVQRNRYAAVLPVLHGAALLIITVYTAVRLHYDAPSREGNGATLGNQLAVVRELAQYPADSELRIEVENYRQYPQGLRALRAILPPSRASRPRAKLLLTYETSDPLDGRIKLVAQ